jgi:hypothetical protein
MRDTRPNEYAGRNSTLNSRAKGSHVMSRLRLVCLVLAGLAVGEIGALAQNPDQQPSEASLAALAAPLQKGRAAIADCRRRRLKQELATYRESAACSRSAVFAAWQEAHYPHMDLITAWLEARELASDQVDQKAIQPLDFEHQMADVTDRLTAEERRRRAGSLSPGDKELRLPPSPQIASVPAAQGRDKRAAAKRDARAGTKPADSASATGVASLGPFVKLDYRDPPRPSGRGRAAATDATGATAGAVETQAEKTRAAIVECRQRRLNKEIVTYRAYAECSRSKIFAAWLEAHYPYMDLITAWLNGREVASEQIDNKSIKPLEFEREMADLTIRLTVEEERRGTGVLTQTE